MDRNRLFILLIPIILFFFALHWSLKETSLMKNKKEVNAIVLNTKKTYSAGLNCLITIEYNIKRLCS
jgi:hypothetical protein